MAKRPTSPPRHNPPPVSYTAPSLGWKIGDRVSVEFDGEPYGGKIMKLGTGVAYVHFDDGEDHEIELERLVRQRNPIPSSGDSDEEDDDGGADDVDYTVEKGERVLKTDAKGKPIVVKQKGGELRFNPPSKGARAHHQYPVVWDERGLFFNVWAAPDAEDVTYGENANRLAEMLKGSKTGMVHFTGEWRKTKFARQDDNGKVLSDSVPGWSIDMRATVDLGEGKSRRFLVESLRYEDVPNPEGVGGDPRRDMHSLNSDICAAIRRWFFFEVKGDADTVRQLVRRANKPEVRAPSLEWLDRLILRLHETRDTALRAGGERTIVIDTGTDGDATFAITMNFSDVAIATEGKPPSLYTGGMTEGIVKSGGSTGKGLRGERGKAAPVAKTMAMTPDPSNVAALTARVAELNALAKNGDMAAKAEARKIRSALRKMGHAGGARSAAQAKAVATAD